MTKHTDLIARLEALTGPDREVDNIIGRLAISDDWDEVTDDDGNKYMLNRSYYHQTQISDARPTASLDAAIALCERVLPGCYWLRENPYTMTICWRNGNEVLGGFTEGEHALPAIALLIATLKALDAKDADHD